MGMCILMTVIVVYMFSVIGLGIVYGRIDMRPSFWAVVSLMVPILNTVMIFLLIPKESLNIKRFINEIKEHRNERT